MNQLYNRILLYYSDNDSITLECSDVTVTESVFNLTNTCSITISKLDTYSDSTSIYIQDNSFTIGSKVEVYLGYHKPDLSNAKKVFTGYLSSWKNSNDSVKLEFEDNMYILKNDKRIKKSFPSGMTLLSIVEDILPDDIKKYKVIDLKAGGIKMSNYLLPSEVLSMIKELYGVYCFFKNNTLYVGHKYWAAYESKYGIPDTDKSQTYKFKLPNVKQEGYYLIKNTDLDYNIINKNSYKVVGTSIQNYKNIKYEYPENIKDPSNIITLNIPDTDLNSLKVIVKARWDDLDKGGFTGQFEVFGHPLIHIGDVVSLEIDMSHINKSPRVIKEKYFVDEVTREFGQNGYKQIIKIGNKL